MGLVKQYKDFLNTKDVANIDFHLQGNLSIGKKVTLLKAIT